MLNIAVTADDPFEMELLLFHMKTFFELKNCPHRIDHFFNLNRLQNQLSKENFQILLLDMKAEIEKRASLELIKKIQNITADTHIIFIADDSRYFSELSLAGRVYLIMKEKLKEQLPIVLENIVKFFYSSTAYGIPVMINRKTLILPLHEVFYLEKKLRKICFNCRHPEKYLDRAEIMKREANNEKLTVDTYGSFEFYRPFLTEYFCQTHRSYIVNLNYVKLKQRNGLILFNDDLVPISRNFKSAVTEQINQLFF